MKRPRLRRLVIAFVAALLVAAGSRNPVVEEFLDSLLFDLQSPQSGQAEVAE